MNIQDVKEFKSMFEDGTHLTDSSEVMNDRLNDFLWGCVQLRSVEPTYAKLPDHLRDYEDWAGTWQAIGDGALFEIHYLFNEDEVKNARFLTAQEEISIDADHISRVVIVEEATP